MAPGMLLCGCRGWWRRGRVVAMMLAIDAAFAVMNIMIKKALDAGTDRLALITFRQLVAAVVLLPVAHFRERKMRPKLTKSICLHLFFSAALGAALTQYLFLVGLQYTSATFACAFANILPVLTFLMALLFRLETLNLKQAAGILKAVGAVVCVAGALVLSLYKGATLTAAGGDNGGGGAGVSYSSRQRATATCTLFAACLCYASWFLVQSKVGQKYPAIYSGAALTFLISFLQAAALSLALQRGFSMWLLKSKLAIATVLYSGVVGSGVGFLAMSWCVEQRGPLFASAFTPLTQILVAVIDTSLLHTQLYLGSVLGSALVIAGLYFLLWGKSKDGDQTHKCEANSKESNEEENKQQQQQTV
ncbi:WAT1-related protein At3g30340-like [Zingiber officinale]|uniref:WAT1-related protein At3g30340-like n=1 Tax=Zingiber officinale TaxID=94328 RepID=UPI001C4C38D3|nr:WAT1-related protein At3g30340-like [Zingiber officinale]